METPEISRVQLLIRACGDAIEHNLHYVRLDAAPNHLVHEVFAAAGGEQRYHEAESGEVFLVKLFAPFAFLRSLYRDFQRRAKHPFNVA